MECRKLVCCWVSYKGNAYLNPSLKTAAKKRVKDVTWDLIVGGWLSSQTHSAKKDTYKNSAKWMESNKSINRCSPVHLNHTHAFSLCFKHTMMWNQSSQHHCHHSSHQISLSSNSTSQTHTVSVISITNNWTFALSKQ